MGDRCGQDVAVMLGQFPVGDLVDDQGVPRPIGLHDAFRHPRGAAGELDGLRLVARQVVPLREAARGTGPAGRAAVPGPLPSSRIPTAPLAARACSSSGAPVSSMISMLGSVASDDAFQLRRGAARVQRHPGLAGGQHRQQRHDMADAACRADADAAGGPRIGSRQGHANASTPARSLGVAGRQGPGHPARYGRMPTRAAR